MVKSNGTKLWRYKYRFAGKEKTLSLGSYPTITLAIARELHTDARKQLARGQDPSLEKQQLRLHITTANTSQTFEAMYRGWTEARQQHLATATLKKNKCIIENNITPYIGLIPVEEISRLDFVNCLDRIVSRGAISTAKRAAALCHNIMVYAANRGILKFVCTTDLKKAIYQAEITEHFAAITQPHDFGKLLAKIDNYSGSEEIRKALALAPLLFQKPGKLLQMEWSEIDLDAATWTIPLSKKKERKQVEGDHIVPLSTQASALLYDLKPLTDRGKYVFRNQRDRQKPKPTESLNKALRALGYCTKTQQCAHGFRASARTLLDEQLQIKVELIESQLSHAVRDTNGRAYNRTSFLNERKHMMQRWADYCELHWEDRGSAMS